LLGWIIRLTPNQISIQTRLNIRLCFPDLNSLQQKQLGNESIWHTSCSFLEPAYLWQRPVQQALNQITKINVPESFYQSGKARIIIAPHHGSWELLNLWLAHQGELFSLYKPARNERIDRYIYKCRTRNGARLVAVNTSGLKSLLQALKNKKTCMILPDQRPGKNMAHTMAPFFDFQVSTPLLINKLCQKIDSDVFIGAVTRNLQTAKYEVSLQALDRDQLALDDQHSATYLNKCIEKFVSSHISQYQWSYRRFRKEDYDKLQK
jgi:KDO2-lipid IV(A) lauroyltransferase